LDGIEKNKMTEKFSLFRDNPAENNEKNNGIMASEVRQPGQSMIENGCPPPSICPHHEFQFQIHY
jgi:hypothetical protein